MLGTSLKRHRRLSGLVLVALLIAVALVGATVSQSRSSPDDQLTPTFSGLDAAKVAPEAVDAQVRSTLDEIGVDPNAETSVVQQDDAVVTVVRTPEHYYVALDKGPGTPAAVSDTPVKNLISNAGSYVLVGLGGKATTAAVLVPDGVTSVDVANSDGSQVQVPVNDNVAVVERTGGFSVTFEYNGTTLEPVPNQTAPVDSPAGKP